MAAFPPPFPALYRHRWRGRVRGIPEWEMVQQQAGPRVPADVDQLERTLVILLAAASWGHCWRGRSILFHCDNSAVVDIWNKGSTRQPHIMLLEEKFWRLAPQADTVPSPICHPRSHSTRSTETYGIFSGLP